MCFVEIAAGLDQFGFGAEDDQNGVELGLTGYADGAFEEGFGAELDELFGLAEAAGGSGREDDGGDSGLAHGRVSSTAQWAWR